MGINKVTLMEAYMIETIRSNGISIQELLTQLEQGNKRAWESINPNYNYDDLIVLYNQDKSAFKSILTDGYKVKFITIRGLQALLEMKFKKTAGEDYISTDKGMEHLTVTEKELTMLNQLLSKNWTIEELPTDIDNDQLKEISIQLANLPKVMN
ncbi:hypothetical protein QTL97_04570 [Sporosarcina thermotolerans]|uniref:HTH merR-type domain-containing protein n=1 Tax=Sporosarcina thermotolerans TaxID=633404 RepID=A0AAW9A974_9BACL|nr:hypothetical protein [Sporosarcina thermotolerans]MDW0116196.1 hypothetical protein [Sporosarcina thermotolerans]WHT48173.1 hypothetical protein QNH10_19455 [Sporosarcina thermotolerans]